MKWLFPEDIDWPFVETTVRTQLVRLFSSPPNSKPMFELVFWIDTNGGLNFDVYQRLPGDTQVRFGDIVAGWNDGLKTLDAALTSVVEGLSEKEDYESIQAIDSKLRGFVRSECLVQAARHFGYSSDTEVRWRIQDEEPRPRYFP